MGAILQRRFALLALPTDQRLERLRRVLIEPSASTVPPAPSLAETLASLASDVRQAIRLAECGAGARAFANATAEERREGLRGAFAALALAEGLLSDEIRRRGESDEGFHQKRFAASGF